MKLGQIWYVGTYRGACQIFYKVGYAYLQMEFDLRFYTKTHQLLLQNGSPCIENYIFVII